MNWVGISGGIGSGKSLAAQFFAQYCAIPVLNADTVARELTAANGMALPAIRQAFGDSVFQHNGQLDRAALRHQIFRLPEARATLEAILHPLIITALQQAQAHTPPAAYGIIEIPLLIEKPHFQQLTQRILIIDCPIASQIRRVQQRSRLTRNAILAIIHTQATRAQRRAIADDIVHNHSSLSLLQRQLHRLHQGYLKQFAPHHEHHI